MNLTACAMDKPSRDCRIIHASPPVALDKPLVLRSHNDSQRSCGYTSNTLTIKSVRI